MKTPLFKGGAILVIFAFNSILTSFGQNISLSIGYMNDIDKIASNSDVIVSVPQNGLFFGADCALLQKKAIAFFAGAYIASTSKHEKRLLDNGEGVYSATSTNNNTFIGIPSRIEYSLIQSNYLVVGLYCGPTFGIGLKAKSSSSTTIVMNDKENTTDKITDYFKDGIISRINLLIGGGVFVGYRHFQLFSGYDAGIINRMISGDGSTYHSSTYTLGIRYFI